MNVLTLLQSVCYEANLPAPSSGLASSTDPAVLQLIHLFYSVGRDLLQQKCWPQLKRVHTVTCTSGDTAYALPSDYYCSVLDAAWDTTNKWKMGGPLSDSQFNELLYGYAITQNRKSYRIFGRPGTDQIQINPDPSTGDVLSFEYLSDAWIATASYAAWQTTITADTNLTAFDDDLMIAGIKFKLYREKGWQYQPYEQEFKNQIDKAQARFNGSQKTSLYKTWPYPGYANMPEGNF